MAGGTSLTFPEQSANVESQAHPKSTGNGDKPSRQPHPRPHLSSVAAHEPEKILANILDPNLDIQPGYHAYFATLKNCQQLFGLLTGEAGASLTFKLPDATTRTLRRDEITDLKSTGLSLMPEGLETTLTPQDLADLIHFLRQPAP